VSNRDNITTLRVNKRFQRKADFQDLHEFRNNCETADVVEVLHSVLVLPLPYLFYLGRVWRQIVIQSRDPINDVRLGLISTLPGIGIPLE
jgi:hypothetical protein